MFRSLINYFLAGYNEVTKPIEFLDAYVAEMDDAIARMQAMIAECPLPYSSTVERRNHA